MIWTRLPTCSDRRGRVEADIAGTICRLARSSSASGVGDLVDVTARGKQAEQIGLEFGHDVGRIAEARGRVIPGADTRAGVLCGISHIGPASASPFSRICARPQGIDAS